MLVFTNKHSLALRFLPKSGTARRPGTTWGREGMGGIWYEGKRYGSHFRRSRMGNAQSNQESANDAGGSLHTTSYHKAGAPILVDAKFVAFACSLSPRKVWTLTKRDALPHHRIDRSVRYELGEITAWVTAGCPTAAGAAKRIRQGMRS